MKDLIERQAAIDAICDNCDAVEASCPHYPCGRYVAVEKLPSAQPEQKTCVGCVHENQKGWCIDVCGGCVRNAVDHYRARAEEREVDNES